MDFEKIRQDFPIVELMARLGCDMTHHGNMYRAPYREDIEPSMSVNVRRNLWCDFGRLNADGSPLGGGNIELIKEIKGINTNLEAATEIVEIFNRPLEDYKQDLSAYRNSANNHKEQSSIRITAVQNGIQKRGLKDYLSQRCIDPSLASLWCSEIHFAVGERNLYACMHGCYKYGCSTLCLISAR